MTDLRKDASRVALPAELGHSLMEHSPVPMAQLEGAQHLIRYVNPVFCRLVGKDRDALLDRPFSETIQEGGRCREVFDRVYRTGRADIHTEPEQMPPHPRFFWSYVVWPVLDAEEHTVGIMMQVTETTWFHQQATAMNQRLLLTSVRQQEIAEASIKLNDELERRVSERTKALEQSEARLRVLATELNLAEQRERKRLATELHDYLAQLLVFCRMTLTRARGTGLPATGEGLLNQTEETLGTALTYCRTLMAELNPPVLHERGLTAGLTWLADNMKRHDLAVTLDVKQSGDLPLPEDRAVLLFQSVRELLINVAKHGAVKRASVQMTYAEGLLHLVVHDDNGFDLVAAEAPATPSALSSKFGLFSIRERMKALGGSFDLQSMPGKGTTATLTLPLIMRMQDAEVGSELVENTVGQQPFCSSQSPTPKKNTTIRLLLVDDHALMREGLRSIVSAYDHFEVVGEAGDGVAAVELAQKLDPEVVLMDINMPRMDGIEATKCIKANQPHTVVIGLSVLSSPNMAQRMLAAGAAAFMTKESAGDALRQAIDEAVSLQRRIVF
jgi:signal transduction histidine kinase/ActR/RegA family two-component response regulator